MVLAPISGVGGEAGQRGGDATQAIGEVVDLMAALRESVERTKKQQQSKKRTAKKPARKAS